MIPLWAVILLVLYVIGVVGLFVAIRNEAPRQGVSLSKKHYLVALFWPLWGIWYLFVLAKEAIQMRRGK